MVHVVRCFVLHCGLSVSDEAATDKERESKILWYYPEQTSSVEQLKQAEVAQALLSFADNVVDLKEGAVPGERGWGSRSQMAHIFRGYTFLTAVLREHVYAFLECNPLIWVVMCFQCTIQSLSRDPAFNRPATTSAASMISRSLFGFGGKVPSYMAVGGSSMLDDGLLKDTMCGWVSTFMMFHGSDQLLAGSSWPEHISPQTAGMACRDMVAEDSWLAAELSILARHQQLRKLQQSCHASESSRPEVQAQLQEDLRHLSILASNTPASLRAAVRHFFPTVVPGFGSPGPHAHISLLGTAYTPADAVLVAEAARTMTNLQWALRPQYGTVQLLLQVDLHVVHTTSGKTWTSALHSFLEPLIAPHMDRGVHHQGVFLGCDGGIVSCATLPTSSGQYSLQGHSVWAPYVYDHTATTSSNGGAPSASSTSASTLHAQLSGVVQKQMIVYMRGQSCLAVVLPSGVLQPSHGSVLSSGTPPAPSVSAGLTADEVHDPDRGGGGMPVRTAPPVQHLPTQDGHGPAVSETPQWHTPAAETSGSQGVRTPPGSLDPGTGYTPEQMAGAGSRASAMPFSRHPCTYLGATEGEIDLTKVVDLAAGIELTFCTQQWASLEGMLVKQATAAMDTGSSGGGQLLQYNPNTGARHSMNWPTVGQSKGSQPPHLPAARAPTAGPAQSATSQDCFFLDVHRTFTRQEPPVGIRQVVRDMGMRVPSTKGHAWTVAQHCDTWENYYMAGSANASIDEVKRQLEQKKLALT